MKNKQQEIVHDVHVSFSSAPLNVGTGMAWRPGATLASPASEFQTHP
jgi:hypothetical protein